jgi:hypothetical protein
MNGEHFLWLQKLSNNVGGQPHFTSSAPGSAGGLRWQHTPEDHRVVKTPGRAGGYLLLDFFARSKLRRASRQAP